ncbi:MAG TPA: GspH/FimT family pseudopilin [Brevundimonas sp.]|nr:GspH/FimT family pseudopilin [Brevundimonas sp.]
MPRLATAGPGRHGRTGMTLVEMLVVIAIVGVSAGMVVLAVGGGRDDAAAQTEANRLADRLRLAADEALVAGRPVTLSMNAAGYGFETGAASSADWAARHELPRGVRLSARQAELVIDPDGAAPPATMAVRDGNHVWTVTFDGLNADVVAATPEDRS